MNDARTAQRLAVAAEIRALMGRHEVSQERLGQAINVGQTGLSRRLRGKVPFDLDELLAIADHFDVPAGSLIPAKTGNPGPNSECVTADRTNSLIAV
jgi:transcriptional regulator with XRE-family HTH domain